MAIRWIDEGSLLLLHDESLTRFGGAPGLRDAGLLSSALARPRAKAAYDSPDLAALGAAYAFGVARNHPFIDGNKRTAFLALGLFLALNGRRLTAAPEDATSAMLKVAAGDIDEAALAAWVRLRMQPA